MYGEGTPLPPSDRERLVDLEARLYPSSSLTCTHFLSAPCFFSLSPSPSLFLYHRQHSRSLHPAPSLSRLRPRSFSITDNTLALCVLLLPMPDPFDSRVGDPACNFADEQLPPSLSPCPPTPSHLLPPPSSLPSLFISPSFLFSLQKLQAGSLRCTVQSGVPSGLRRRPSGTKCFQSFGAGARHSMLLS